MTTYDDNDNNTNLTLRSRAKHGVSKDGSHALRSVAVLRDAGCAGSSG